MNPTPLPASLLSIKLILTILTLSLLLTTPALLASPQILSAHRDGTLRVTNLFTNGVATVEQASLVTGPWRALKSFYTSNTAATLSHHPPAATTTTTPQTTAFRRVFTTDLSGAAGFTNLIHSYSLLSTIAGAGGSTSAGVNKWRPEFENAPAGAAQLSRPHIAMSDAAGNVFIADKDAHGIRRVGTNGLITTVAGTSVAGNGPDTPSLATTVALNEPNGLWVRSDGTVYILDLQNGKIRRLQTNGVISTLFTIPSGISSGRGLWVSDDEKIAYVSSGSIVKKWTAGEGVVDFATGFSQLGNLSVDPFGNLVVTDRNAHRIYRLDENGSRTLLAGNGTTSGGGDGQLAIETGLAQVRAICFLPTGAFFVGTDSGAQMWYVDTAGIIHLFLNGSASNAHAGDGAWFYQPSEFRTGPVRAITMTKDGDLLITENDAGYIRKIRFLPNR